MEIETQTPEPTETLPPMEDTIREELHRLTGGTDTIDTGEEEGEPNAGGDDGRVRDPTTGRFASPKADAEPAGDEPTGVDAETAAEDAEPVADETDEPATEYADGDVATPPNTWRGEAKALYDALPPQVKAEIHKRESDFHRGIGEYRGWAQIGQTLDAAVQPHAQMLRAAIQAGEYENAPAAVGDALDAMRVFRTGSADEKAGLVLSLVNRFGITPESLQAANERMQNTSPEVAALHKELREIRTMMARQSAEQQSAGPSHEVVAEVERFMTNPKNEFAKHLRPTMTRLVEQGLASSLQEAYDKACEQDPTVKAKLTARRQEAEQKRRAEVAARARKAGSVNVVRRGQPPTPTPKGTLEDTIRSEGRRLGLIR